MLWQVLLVGVAATVPGPAVPTADKSADPGAGDDLAAADAGRGAPASAMRWAAGSGSVLFDPPTASVVGLEHPEGAIQRPRDGGAPQPPIEVDGSGCRIFSVRMWPSQGQPFGNASNPADGWEVSESVAIPDARWELLANDTAADEFVYAYRDSVSGVEATLAVVANSGSPLELTMRLRNSGSAALYVAELAFPRLCGIVAPVSAELVSSGGPRGTGLRVADPVRHINDAQLQWFEYGFSPYLTSDSYPHAMMNWLAVATPAEALYLGVHDTALLVTALRANSHVANRSIQLALAANATVALPPHGDGAKATDVYSRPVVLSLVRSEEKTSYAQWHAAAQIYRNWLNSALVPLAAGTPRHPDWLRQGFTGVDLSGDYPQQFYGERETEIDAPWFYGLEILNLWGQAINPQCCPGYPCPDPGRGGAAGFKAYVDRLHSAGIRVGTYFESECANPVFSNVTSFRGQRVDELPASQRPPVLKQVAEHTSMLAPGWAHNHGGNLQPGPVGEWGSLPGNYDRLVAQIDEQTGGYEDVGSYFKYAANGSDTHLLLPMHYSADGWFQTYLAGWLELYGTELGTDAPYLDQLGFFPTGPNFAESGMLPEFGDGGAPRRILDFLLTSAARSFPRQRPAAAGAGAADGGVVQPFFFTYEGYTDSYGALGGGALLSGHREIPCREMCDNVSALMESRCALCTQQLPWINTTGIIAAFEVARAAFPLHAVFEGTCNVGPSTPVALHAVARGFCDGHKADLSSFGGASGLGFLSPLVWLREGIAPWIEAENSEYFFDSGVVTTPPGWLVRQHRGVQHRLADWSMFLYFAPDAAAGSLTVNATAKSLWYLMESTGECRVLTSCAGQTRCVVNAFRGKAPQPVAAAVGAVLAVRIGVAPAMLPEQSLSLLKLEIPAPSHAELILSTLNVGTTTLNITAPITEFAGGSSEVRVLPLAGLSLKLTVPPNSAAVFSTVIDMTGRNLPARLEVDLPDAAGVARRLAPVPIADPHFNLRRFASGTIPHPAANASSANQSQFAMQLSAVGGKLTQAYRHLYWPVGVNGTVHIRMRASDDGSGPGVPVPMNGLVSWQPRNSSVALHASLCVFRPLPSQGWVIGQMPIVGLANMSWLPLVMEMAGGPLQIPGLLQLNASLLIDKLEALPVGETPAWQGTETPIACSAGS